MKTLSHPSPAIFFTLFFSLLKAALFTLFFVVAVLIIGQSRVAPVSVHLLTAYAMQYAVHTFKPARPFFPQPYAPHLNIQ